LQVSLLTKRPIPKDPQKFSKKSFVIEKYFGRCYIDKSY